MDTGGQAAIDRAESRLGCSLAAAPGIAASPDGGASPASPEKRTERWKQTLFCFVI